MTCLGAPAIATAQEAGAGITDTIVVTAQKRSQSIQDVGIAITAYSGDQLEKLGVETSIDIINFTPGVSMAGDIGGQRALFNIRGVVQNDFSDLAEPRSRFMWMKAIWPALRRRHLGFMILTGSKS